MPWLVAQTKWREESRADRELRNQAFNVLMPTVLVKHVAARRGEMVSERPLFTGYLFVEYCLDTDRWTKIANTPGIRRIIMAGLLPIPLRKGEAERLAERCASGPFKDFEEAEAFIAVKPGDMGRIDAGALAGYSGKCLSVSKTTATLELWWFKRRIEAEVPRSFVRALS